MDKPVLSEDDIVKLVKLVERKPEIWDKSCNKDSDRKRRAWTEICNEFHGHDWDFIPDAEKKILEETYMGKWKNLRDVFIKSMKWKQPYKHHEILKFLLKNLDSKTQSSPEPTAQAGPSNEPSNERKLKRPSLLARKKLASKQKRMMVSVQTSEPPEGDRQQSPLPEAICIPTSSVHSTTESHEDSESVVDGDESDKHFFISVLPMIKNFSTIQKLDFRLGVLNVIKDIKDSSKISNSSPALLTDVKQEITVSDSE